MVSPAPRAGRTRGFTFPELMAVMAVIAILASMAAPAYSTWISNVRARSAGTDLYSALAKARSEAIKRNAEITLAPAEGGWAGGWNIAHPVDADTLLDDHAAVPGATIVGPDSVVYLPNGRVKGGEQPTFDISVAGNDQHRCVRVDLSGRPSHSLDAC